ncbi:MAG: type II secretion system protein [Actinomycetota bacterium]|nr:type II secretion system protein [Actinomycetota bacterium]
MNKKDNLRCLNQDSFTIAELLIVIGLIGILLTVTVISYAVSNRSTDQRAGVEMLKEEIRRVYSLANSAVKTNGQRDRYRIEFRRLGEGSDPKNCYRVLKLTWNGSSWVPGVVPAMRQTSVKIVDEANGWVRPFSSGEPYINAYTGMSTLSGYNGVTFVSKGSIVETDTAGEKTVIVRVPPNSDITIRISQYGSVSE